MKMDKVQEQLKINIIKILIMLKELMTFFNKVMMVYILNKDF